MRRVLGYFTDWRYSDVEVGAWALAGYYVAGKHTWWAALLIFTGIVVGAAVLSSAVRVLARLPLQGRKNPGRAIHDR